MHKRLLLSVAAVIAACAAVLWQEVPVAAAAPGATGHDISWPQCGSSFPASGSFGIAGVTNGRPWSTNPCLLAEYQWAAGYGRTPDLYMNTANPAPHSSYYWPASGARDPAPCTDATTTTDPGCAYDYGWHAAASALAAANATLGSRAQGAWWLDVETGNTWNGDGSSNAADIQGSVDYLLSQRVAGVGVYSTDYQWTAITGGYTTSTASSYAAAWQPEFTSPNGLSGIHSWVAGASGPSDAPSYCGSSFLGTTTWLVQYISGGFDVDYLCAAAPQPADYIVSTPPVNAKRGSSVTTTITLTSTSGWSGTVTLSISKPSSVSAALSTSTLTVAANSSATAKLTLRSGTAGKYSVTVTARPRVGSRTTTAHSATLTFTVSRLSNAV